jgi:hypothetical protein
MADEATNAPVNASGEDARPNVWLLRLTTIIWVVLVLGCLLSLPVIFDASALFVLVAILIALVVGAIGAWLLRLFLTRQREKNFLHIWFKASLGSFCLLTIAMAGPIYYLAIETETDPLLLPRVTLSNGEKTVVYQGMMHIGTERFYKQVVYDAEKALADGYVLYYEGVQPNPAADQWFAETLAGGGDLSANYRAMGKVCGLQFQLDYFKLLQKDMEVHPGSHVTADVDALQMKQEYERLVATDPEFAAAVKGSALQKKKAEDVQRINSAIEWLDKGTPGQRKLAGVVCRWMMNGVKEAHDKPGPLDKVIVDFRNRALVDQIMADSHDKIYITYGAHHLEGVIPLLKQRDPKWQVESVSWIRPIEAPRHLEAEL